MRLIDADANIETMKKCAANPESAQALLCYRFAQRILEEAPTVEHASPWHGVEEPPEPHKDVLVTGMESINNSRVYKVMVNDNGTWRPTDYAPSIRWDYWMPIEPPKEE